MSKSVDSGGLVPLRVLKPDQIFPFMDIEHDLPIDIDYLWSSNRGVVTVKTVKIKIK